MHHAGVDGGGDVGVGGRRSWVLDGGECAAESVIFGFGGLLGIGECGVAISLQALLRAGREGGGDGDQAEGGGDSQEGAAAEVMLGFVAQAVFGEEEAVGLGEAADTDAAGGCEKFAGLVVGEFGDVVDVEVAVIAVAAMGVAIERVPGAGAGVEDFEGEGAGGDSGHEVLRCEEDTGGRGRRIWGEEGMRQKASRHEAEHAPARCL